MTSGPQSTPSSNSDGARADVANGKGKEKERSPPRRTERNPNTAGGDGSSMTSRIASSTVGLASSMLSGTPSNSALASATSEKGSTSAAGASRSHHEEGFAQSRPDIATGPQPFRTSQARDHAAAAEAAFSDFLDSTPVFQPAGPSKAGPTWPITSAATTGGHVRADDGSAAYPSVAEQESRDGEAVVSLLMDPNEHLPDLLEDGVLSPEERDSLRKALFGQSPGLKGQSVDWNHVLNFVPDYLRVEEPSAESYMDTGLSDPAEAWRGWVAQWEDVLTRYHDEVWGDLGSLVKEARQEVEHLAKVQPDGPPPETPALRRLRAILGHLRG